MDTSRLEAFSDGVFAIIITIMVLELKVPHGADIAAIKPLLPIFLNYILSFIYLGIYWGNHHHMFQATKNVSGKILWANLHLLFWLSMFPVTTGWMGSNHFATLPTALYAFVLMMAAIAYRILELTIINYEGKGSRLARAIGSDLKGNLSILLYAIAVIMAFVYYWVSLAIFIIVAIMWLIPSKRIERAMDKKTKNQV
jgi:uncharacterized membrane protein